VFYSVPETIEKLIPVFGTRRLVPVSGACVAGISRAQVQFRESSPAGTIKESVDACADTATNSLSDNNPQDN